MKLEEIIRKTEEVMSGREDIIAAYLFGSFAAGREHEDSDVDIGIVVSGKKDFTKLTSIEKEVSDKLERKADIRVLNDQDTRFKYQVLKTGRLIFSCDEEKRTEFEEDAMRNYLDMKPFYENYDRFVKERLTA
ncbi:MAG: nucleotidyltransferase domain-containing protein [Candidatus Nanohalobium sp.]